VSPYPMDPVRSVGPARLVLSAFPDRESALTAVGTAIRQRIAACGTLLPGESRYLWRGRVETQSEVLVLFKTVPKHVGALFRLLERTHPYEVPEIVEVDLPRVGSGYLRYLAGAIDPDSPPPPLGAGPTRRGSPRARAAPRPARTRGPHRRRSR
jgi:periplasmic divalent cation tolerance protein